MNKLAERLRAARRRDRRLGFGPADAPQAASRGLLIAGAAPMPPGRTSPSCRMQRRSLPVTGWPASS